jgi:hypothetical protein
VIDRGYVIFKHLEGMYKALHWTNFQKEQDREGYFLSYENYLNECLVIAEQHLTF